MQSPDWPDLPFVKPAAYGTGRDGRRAMFSVVHYTAGSERSTSAEDGAAYDARRTDGTSTHYFHDSNSTVQCVRLADRANACFYHGNRLGIQHELCGTQQTRAQWLDPASRATIRRTAGQIVRDHTRLSIPIRRLTVAQVRACWYDGAPGGICGHADVTLAFPEDHGSHMDPGTEFPWDVLFHDIDDIRNGADMTDFTNADPNAWHLATRVDALRNLQETTALNEPMPIVTLLKAIAAKVDIDQGELAAIEAAAKAGAASAADDIVARVLAGLPEGTLTADDVEAAVRDAFAGGLAPDEAAPAA